MDFKACAQGKINQLEENMMGGMETVEDEIAFSTPVTAQKVKRTLKNDFDEDGTTEVAVRKVKPKGLRKVDRGSEVDDREAGEEDDVIAVEDVQGKDVIIRLSATVSAKRASLHSLLAKRRRKIHDTLFMTIRANKC